MTPAGLKKLFEQQFAAAGIETPSVDAALLISDAAGISQLDMILNPEKVLSPGTEAHLRTLALRRCQREPLQYITGKAYFRDLVLSVDPSVLIPRPETELLVDFVDALGCLHFISINGLIHNNSFLPLWRWR